MEQDIPTWILSVDSEDREFIRKFILSSGSLKQIAKDYDVSYPTVRTRLDRIIQLIRLNETLEQETLVKYVKKLAIEEKISLEVAKNIIEKYKAERDGD
ncbi:MULTISPECIES: DUF2089 family protein [Bacillus]|uniref:DUF2089 family protein n=1 Tax=Bacillus TaxID=1386 RepID=UPI000D03357C|nr:MULTISPECIES: DUF2089 family protein [Bacillus]MCY7500390.1 DUF2089 domain-containing protein [Bacillus pumilus]MCY7527057.1 DUF2089 domain-containing protein [Bacillus pumilus]MED4440796.1 DUF2089 family protein [Bacillus pumilus]MED4491969.1 DUF2089 family protein [Bacillus pumilus]PRS57985.1 hypothetical protein C6344_14675 [Bacillus sp. GBSW19]